MLSKKADIDELVSAISPTLPAEGHVHGIALRYAERSYELCQV